MREAIAKPFKVLKANSAKFITVPTLLFGLFICAPGEGSRAPTMPSGLGYRIGVLQRSQANLSVFACPRSTLIQQPPWKITHYRLVPFGASRL